MENCLVTKLKGVVDNAELPILGSLKIKKIDGGIGKIDVLHEAYQGSVTYTIVGDCYFTDSTGSQNYGKSYVSPTGVVHDTVYISSAAGCIIMSNKYDITQISLVNGNIPYLGFEIGELQYNDDISVLNISRSLINGDVTNVKFPKVTDINLFLNQGVYGDFRKWIESTNGKMTRIALNGGVEGSVKISGNALPLISQQSSLTEAYLAKSICSLDGDFSLLGNCDFTSVVLSGQTGLSGSIETFVAAARNKAENPRTSGSVNFTNLYDTNVTWKGVKEYSSATISQLSWTPSTITFFGETIEG